jgi:serine/threonine protein kinase
MGLAALRRLRRRFGLTNAAKVSEAHMLMLDELSQRAGEGEAARGRRTVTALARAAGLGGRLAQELTWASAFGQRFASRSAGEPSDAEVDRFFDVVERVFGTDLADPVEPRDLVGRTVGGRYVIESVVGEGAAGVVYRARHLETDAPVAVKVLHPSKVLRREIIAELEHPRRFWNELVARFRREARAAANLSHPGIVSVFDFGAEGAGFYQAMEFLTGETLRDVIAREAPMSVGQVVRLSHAAALALDAAHRHGVVHRDLKPANLFLCRFDWGEALKVLDFGIAKLVQEAEDEASRLTETGVFLGTYRYASPEQCLGERVTPAADVYALGVIMFEMLAGRPPFEGPSSVLAIRHATARPPRLDEFRHDLPEGLANVVDRTLAKQPDRRYACGGELAAALAGFLGVADAPSPQPPSRRRVPAEALLTPAGRSAAASQLAGVSRGKSAREFAEMLVRELLHYFPMDIGEGRKTHDIYRRLHGEIDVRWSLYASRYAGEPVDHFHEMLVSLLAEGDASRLGPGLPDSTTHQRRRRRAHVPPDRGSRD